MQNTAMSNRNSRTGVISGLVKEIDTFLSLSIFRKMCMIKFFEEGLIDVAKNNHTKYPLYLSRGQEAISSALSLVIPNFTIFAQHRCHGTYLAFGGDPVKLRDELLGLPSGTSRGRAGSNCLQYHDKNIAMFGHHGLIGENVPLAAGYALGTRKNTVCFFGDGAAEEDYVFAAMGFATTHSLPVLFICEDNNLSILTPVKDRRSWNLSAVAKALGMQAIEIADDPWTIYKTAQDSKSKVPAFINIFTCRANWHAGVGVDAPPEWDRFALVKEELTKLGLANDIKKTEDSEKEAMAKIWDKEQLQILLGK